ncbi:MAG: RluA family pseudouridine synthase [Chloroflexota bacterium]|nr:RluA family pseudouridine synthase [Chloroflexota bacterium]
MSQIFRVDEGGVRLDSYLVSVQSAVTRSRIQTLIASGFVTVNGSISKSSYKVRHGDSVALVVPRPKPVDIIPQDIPLQFIYQDEDIVVIDKPAGLSVHPGPGHPDGTLVNALMAHCPDIAGVGGEIRPGIVHRLDKDTSGLIMVAKTHDAHIDLSNQIKNRTVTKGYLALAAGTLATDSGIIDAPIARDPKNRKRMAVVLGGKESRTKYTVIDRFSSATYLDIRLETGRTHQIRVHLAYSGNPLVGDQVYGKRSDHFSRHFLHANHLGFKHPSTGQEIEFTSKLPKDLESGLGMIK